MSVINDFLNEYPKLRLKKFWQIYLRDAKCMHCGLVIAFVDKGCFRPANGPIKFNIDHIIPSTRGGSNDVTNLQVLCEPCNSFKDNRLECEYLDIPSDFYTQLAQHKTNKELPYHPEWRPWYGF